MLALRPPGTSPPPDFPNSFYCFFPAYLVVALPAMTISFLLLLDSGQGFAFPE
jgi:hypothetical protein